MAAPSYLAWWVAALLVQCVSAQVIATPVNTSAGLVLGKMTTVRGRGFPVQVEAFLGIPYAKPPTGDLRFKKTQPVEPWTGVRNAWDPPKACIQKVDNDVITSPDQMSENCLYLNIWRPYCNLTYRMVTMVWIHGGSLKSGSSADPLYNGAKLAAEQCVIVASMNYRLNVFGFLYTGYPEHRGNAGLFDVLSALQFINSNIYTFGGNNTFITLFGSGAGAYIVSTFLMSTLGRDLFRNAILQSGSPLMQMMYQSREEARNATIEVAERVGCSNTTDMEILICLKNVTSTNLLDAFHATTGTLRFMMVSTNDNDFLTMDPTTYLASKSVKNCSILVGTNKDEGTESLIKILPSDFNTSSQVPPVFTEQKIDMILSRFLRMLYKAPYVPHIVTAMKLIYDYDNLMQTTNPSLRFLSNICRDLAYTCPQQKLIDTYTQLGNKVYVYSFDRAPNITNLPAWVGATHRSEIRYIFRTTPNNRSENFTDNVLSADNVLSIWMMHLWGNFARRQNPIYHRWWRPVWHPYFPGNNILVFTKQAGKVLTEDQKENCHYWNSLPDQMKN